MSMTMSLPLTKSYVNTCNPDKPAKTDLVFREFFDEAKKEKLSSLLVNMDTGERLSNLTILDKAESYERGLLSLGLEPGVDNIAIIGCASFEALAIFAAAAELGYGFAQYFFHPPRGERMAAQLPMITPKVVFTGEGAGGHNFDALLEFFQADAEKPTSDKFPFVERIFYDSSYKDRSPPHKFIQTFDDLIKLGENVSDEQLLRAKSKVEPEFDLHHLFTSGSTGAPKCATRTQRSLTYFLDANKSNHLLAASGIVMNMNVDTLSSYMSLTFGLIGTYKKIVMIPESYEEKPLVNQGELLTKTIIDEEISMSGLTMSALTSVADYLKGKEITVPLTVPYGGQLISKQFILENQKIFKGFHLVGYGMTEVPMIGSSIYGYKPEELMTNHDVTKLYPANDSELRIVDSEDKVVDIGVMGELQVKNPLAIKGYRNDEKRTRELFTEDGFVRTGDLAVMMDDGYFKVKGRIVGHERFKIFGKVEYAAPLEEIFNEHPDIRHTYVVSGKVNDWMGDEITCCIEMKSVEKRIPEEELLDFCREKGMYKRHTPARIIYFDNFPMTDNKRKVSKLNLTSQVKAMVAEDEELGKCKWFSELEKSGKTY